ncbi:P-loop containing nucleoside triphosphate hydrolase protein [Hysterangium stoloniferum]|nr:P-loop containing nucleoside triphosphate hydrolase protein [Hysterangium stoloniferum]
MPRRKPASSKHRKAELQFKRAVKRGDIPAPPPQLKLSRGKKLSRREIVGGSAITKARRDPSFNHLQSTFLKVEPLFLAASKVIASTVLLTRPLPPEIAALSVDDVGLSTNDKFGSQLTCPKRPKWRFDMAKKEVEANEEAIYQKWLVEIDDTIGAWRASRGIPSSATQEASTTRDLPLSNKNDLLGSPTYYERNIEVWRQLWRVSEMSDIILLLLDSRCPALHFPPSLQVYFEALRQSRPLIIVLTKSDLVPPSYTAAWSAWLRDHYPSARVVKVESYCEQNPHSERKGQGQRKKFKPEMKPDDLLELVEALKAAHEELITPPERIRNNAEKLQNWKPSVRRTVEWTAINGGHAHVEIEEGQEYLTVGLVGQPNVGKSSLLNALFGTHKVKASRTPGKTKHFQTLFWTPHIRFVDCPGLVMPNLVPMELQVLGGILPISQIPSIPSCIHYALCLLPLEQILHLTHPAETEALVEDKRTWRGNRTSKLETVDRGGWTAMDVLVAYANQKGWVTAKAGRSDVNRAGNALLRFLAEGKIRWAFWPPDTPLMENIMHGHGIWLGIPIEDNGIVEEDGVSDASSESGSEEEGKSSDETSSNNDSGIEEEDVSNSTVTTGQGRFIALLLDEPPGSSEDEVSC